MASKLVIMRVAGFIIILFTFVSNVVLSQSPAERVKARQVFCDSNLSDSLVSQFRQELNELEGHFINQGLLKDGTGKSYYAVFEKIAREGDLEFKLTVSFPLLDTLNFTIQSQCFYKALSQAELAKVSIEHLRASEQAFSSMPTNINPGVVAKRLIENFKENYYDLAFFRISSLVTFHSLSVPHVIEGLLPNTGIHRPDIIDTLYIQVDSKNELIIGDSSILINQLQSAISDFLVNDFTTKSIRLNAHRGSSYKTFVKIIQIIDTEYQRLRDEMALDKFDKPYNQLSDSDKKKIRSLIPKNVIMDEPSQNE